MLSTNNALNMVCVTPKKHQESVSRLLSKFESSFKFLDYHLWLNGSFNNLQAQIVLVLPEVEDDKIIVDAIKATPHSNFLVLSQQNFIDELQVALKSSCEFVCWPCIEAKLLPRLNLFKSKSLLQQTQQNKKYLWQSLNLIGQSSAFMKVLSFIEKSSQCQAQVLIEGETGCGKEVVARAIHYLGERRDFPFIPVNCGAIPDQLIENELFGHAKGAYTDAKEAQAGMAEQAHKGTLFLDEIEALSAKGQVSLLRFLEDNQIKPLGSQKSKKLDVRVIAASNVSLAELSSNKLFRQDLLFRLNLLHINLPPLRTRIADITLLTDHFMDKYRSQYKQPNKKLDQNIAAWMSEHNWPGNVRELENFIHRSFLMTEQSNDIGSEITDDGRETYSRRMLFDRRQILKFDTTFHEAKEFAIANFEQRYLTWLISSTKGNVTHAANIASKERRAIGKLLKKYQIDPSQYRNH